MTQRAHRPIGGIGITSPCGLERLRLFRKGSYQEDDGSVIRKWTSGRELWARVSAAVSGFFWLFLFMGLIDLVVPVDETPGFYDSYLLETGWGVLYTFLVGAAFVSLALRPGMVMPPAQVVLVAVCVAVTALAAGSWVQVVPAILLAMNGCAFLVLARRRGRLRKSWDRPALDPVVGSAAVVLVPPAVLFAIDMIIGYREGRPPLDDDTLGIDHWPMQAAWALALAAVALAVAAGVRARWSGTGLSGGCVAAAAAWFGYWSVVYPNHAGSAGATWGLALIGWALVFTVAVGWRLGAQREPATAAR